MATGPLSAVIEHGTFKDDRRIGFNLDRNSLVPAHRSVYAQRGPRVGPYRDLLFLSRAIAKHVGDAYRSGVISGIYQAEPFVQVAPA